MVDPLHKKSWLLVIGLLFMVILSSSVIYAQAGDGTITVNACTDQNADGDCTDDFDSAAPPGVEACLDDDTNCQSIPATFTNLAAGSYTPFLRFPGASQGYYPTTAHTPVDLADGETLEVTLGAVYPVHPKGVAVHEQLNKVYVAFQGPTVISGTEKSSPYPFVAVIDGDTDEVLRTMPGGKDGLVDPSPNSGFVGIGREPWGVGVSGDGQYVYVGSFGDGLVSIIDPTTDMVMTDYSFGVDFMPTSPSVNPLTGNVHFPDYEQGHLLILGNDPANVQVAAPFIEIPPTAFSPFEVVTANALDGYNFVTLRDAILPGPYRIAALNSTDPFGTEFLPIQLPDGSSGPPFAIGLWQEEGMSEPRIFITHADDPRLNPPDVINPNKLLVYSFPVVDPKNILLRNSGIQLGDFAEAGLVHDPVVNLMRGTFGGFAYTNDNGDVAACDNVARGGTYTVNFDGGISPGPEPSIVVGNPPLVDSGLQWKNPFEIAVNPNTGKVYVTDRCWNEFPEGGQPGGGAVLIFETSANGEATSTPTVTSTTTTTSTVTPTPTPGQITLVMNGPSSVALNETFSVDVVAQNVPDPGLYGAQFEINFDPALVSASNLQINPDLSLVIIQNVDNVTGTITLAAAREGNVPGLTGDVTLLTFEVTAGDTPSTANFIFDNVKIGDPQAQAFDVTSQNYSVLIGEAATSTPVTTETPSTSTPTVTGTPPTATPVTTETPSTSTPTVTGTPPTATPVTTETPSTSTPTVTGTPPTSTPTSTGTPPTATPVTTETPSTSTPTVTGTPPTATPVTTETPSTSTPTVTGTPPTATPVTTETPSTSTPTVTGTPPTATPVATETPSTSTPTVTGTPPTSTPTSTGTPPTATPVTTETPSTSTPTVTGTPPTATPVTTETPSTSTPTATGTPPTATPNVTVIVTSTGTPTVTGTPPTSTPTSTGTPPTATPTVTGTPPTATPTVTGTPPTSTPTSTGTPPTNTPTPTPQVTVVVTVSGQVILPGRAGNDWSDTTVTIDDTAQSSTTDTEGNFSIADVTVGVHSSITARTTGFLSAVCNSFTVTSSETDLPAVSLLSGDVSDDDIVDITDATAIGISFGNTGSGLAADINRDDVVDILDIILVGINFGTAGPQAWTCQ